MINDKFLDFYLKIVLIFLNSQFTLNLIKMFLSTYYSVRNISAVINKFILAFKI